MEKYHIMSKSIKVSVFILQVLLLISCSSNAALVMPFEATFHKFVYTLTKDLEQIDYSNDAEYFTLCESSNYAVAIKEGTLAFIDKENEVFFDTFGNEHSNMPESGLNIRITQGTDYELTYKTSRYYNSETDEHIDSLTAFKLNENTVRLLIITGIDEFHIIDKTPIVLPPEFVSGDPNLKQYYSNEPQAKEKALSLYPLLAERFDLQDNLYYLTQAIPDSEFESLGFTKNTAREIALQLNYDYSAVKMILTVVDITVNDDGIIFDISKNRQFRSELIRDKSFKHEIFEFDIDFVEKTASESPKITNAQSKY